jgi:hypothetical protein
VKPGGVTKPIRRGAALRGLNSRRGRMLVKPTSAKQRSVFEQGSAKPDRPALNLLSAICYFLFYLLAA